MISKKHFLKVRPSHLKKMEERIGNSYVDLSNNNGVLPI